jgi:hypothetical protein
VLISHILRLTAVNRDLSSRLLVVECLPNTQRSTLKLLLQVSCEPLEPINQRLKKYFTPEKKNLGRNIYVFVHKLLASHELRWHTVIIEDLKEGNINVSLYKYLSVS